jgi:hypothetical protein
VDLQDTWQAGIFMQVSGGEFWPHNSQLTTRNSLAGAAAGGGGGQPPDPPQKMKASPAIAGPGVTVCAASPFEDDCNPDDDDDDPKDSWWRRLFERVKRWFREKVRWQKYTLQFWDRGRWVIKLNKFTGRDTVSRAEAIKRFWHKYFPRKEPHGHEIWKNFRKIYVRDPNGKVWFP